MCRCSTPFPAALWHFLWRGTPPDLPPFKLLSICSLCTVETAVISRPNSGLIGVLCMLFLTEPICPCCKGKGGGEASRTTCSNTDRRKDIFYPLATWRRQTMAYENECIPFCQNGATWKKFSWRRQKSKLMCTLYLTPRDKVLTVDSPIACCVRPEIKHQ